jgi:hypothetical protein
VIETNDALRLAHEPLDDFTRPALGPVRLVRQVIVDGTDVDARWIVVELDPVGQPPSHLQILAGWEEGAHARGGTRRSRRSPARRADQALRSVRSRKFPKYS